MGKCKLKKDYPIYPFTNEDTQDQLVRFVRLDNPDSYPFDEFHAHEYNEMLFFIKGGGIHNIDFREHAIQDHSIHLLAAGSLHWVERGMTSKGFAVVYKEQYLYKLQSFNPSIDYIKTFSDSSIINLKDEEYKSIEHIIDELIHSHNDTNTILSLLGYFFTKIAVQNLSATVNSSRKQIDKIIIDLIELINQNYLNHCTVSFYAEKLNTTERILNKKIKESLGFSIAKLQQDRLLKEAKKLLISSQDSVKEITFNLGFEETSNFSNWFKKLTGYTPLDYKTGKNL